MMLWKCKGIIASLQSQKNMQTLSNTQTHGRTHVRDNHQCYYEPFARKKGTVASAAKEHRPTQRPSCLVVAEFRGVGRVHSSQPHSKIKSTEVNNHGKG
jgi:hypothetical protein